MEYEKTLYSEILDPWLDEHKLKITAPTAYGYKKSLPAIKEYFKGIYIQDITVDTLYDYVQLLRKKYSVSACARQYCKIMKMSFRYAQKQGYIIYNPAEDVAIPGRTRAEIYPFSEQEMSAILAQDCMPWVKDAIFIAYRTGMRLGEIFGLRWSDINFVQKFIMVQRAQSRACSKVIIKCPKTKSSVRRIDIDSLLVEYLKKMKEDSHKCMYVCISSRP